MKTYAITYKFWNGETGKIEHRQNVITQSSGSYESIKADAIETFEHNFISVIEY